MIQLLEKYGSIYFTRDDKNIEIYEVHQITKNTKNHIYKELNRNKNYYLSHTPILIEEDEETGEMIVIDPDTRKERIFFWPPLKGLDVDPERWRKLGYWGFSKSD